MNAFLVDHRGRRSASEPGTLPPTSVMWPNIAAQADRGLTLVEDRHHQQPVIQVTDCAVARIGIVGDEDVAILDRPLIGFVDEAVVGTLPNWPTTILPSWLAIIGKASCCSRMPGDMAVRNSTASISVTGIVNSAFSTMSRVIGSTSTRLKALGVGFDDLVQPWYSVSSARRYSWPSGQISMLPSLVDDADMIRAG